MEKRKKSGPKVRKGKAMLQIHTISFTNAYIPCDLKGTFMPTDEKGKWLISTCLIGNGSGGYLAPGDFACTLE